MHGCDQEILDFTIGFLRIWFYERAALGKLIYIVAGELSGDMHGEGLMREIRAKDNTVSFLGYGGGGMRAEGGTEDWLDKAAVMGLTEVLKQYKWFKAKMKEMVEHIEAQKPDLLLLIDYPKFNLMLAERVRALNLDIKIVFYISPKVWAWNKKRVPKMARILDKIICIFPFEIPIYEEVGLDAVYVGNPLVDQLGEMGTIKGREEHVLGLFPGSRKREVSKLFPIMIDAAIRLYHRHPELRFSAPAATPVLREKMQEMLDEANLPVEDLIDITEGGSHELMRKAHAGVIASGTATLEAAWLGLPYCLVYKVSFPTYLAARLLVKIKHIGLINILAQEEIVEEFIQGDADPCHIERSLELFLKDAEHRETVQQRLLDTAATMGTPGVNSRAANEVLVLLN